jgi:hypothetical protein
VPLVRDRASGSQLALVIHTDPGTPLANADRAS